MGFPPSQGTKTPCCTSIFFYLDAVLELSAWVLAERRFAGKHCVEPKGALSPLPAP
jgi:hypothetical protein